MDAFNSSALGLPHQYRSWFSDQVGIVLRSKANDDGDLTCRPASDVDAEWVSIYHTRDQIKQVCLDMDAAQLKDDGARKLPAELADATTIGDKVKKTKND